MNETVTESTAMPVAVVVAADLQRRDQWVIDRLLVVAVVGRSVLPAVNFGGKTVDVDGGLLDATASRSRRTPAWEVIR
jgi:hypothetical protein